jgi:hypothetical protein
MTTTSPELERLLRVLRAQRALLGELEACTARRSAALEDPDALLGAMNHRDALIARVEAQSREVDDAHAAWVRVRGPHDHPGDVEDVRVLADELAASLARIEAADQRDASALRDRRQALADQIEGVVRAGRAGRAYAPSGHTPARYQDTEG